MLKYLNCFLLVIFPLTAYGAPECNVRDAQSALARAGFDPGPVDGFWGNATERAVRSFQIQNELTPTTELDQATCTALLQLKQADVQTEPDEFVRQVQAALLGLGLYFDEIDGKPGPTTNAALQVLQHLTGVQNLPQGEGLLRFIEANSAQREERMKGWFDSLERGPLDIEDIQRIEENFNDPSHYKARLAYIPTDLPNHIGYRDETGQFHRVWERDDQTGPNGPEPVVFAGTDPFEFVGYYVNLAEPGDRCEMDNAFSDFAQEFFRYMDARLAAELPDYKYYLLRPSSNYTELDEDPELWCLEHARWGLRFADPSYSMPQWTTAKLAAFDAKRAAETAQAEAATKQAALIEQTRTRMASINDPVALDGHLSAALASGNDVVASATLEALEKLLAKRAARANEDATCHRQIAGFAPYVPDASGLDLELAIFATIGVADPDQPALILTQSEHPHDILSYFKPSFLNAFLSAGEGSTVSVLPAPNLTFEEFLVPDSSTGPILDGAVIRINGDFALGHDGASVFEFKNAGDEWHRLTFRIGTKTGLTYMRGKGSVTVDGTTHSFDGTVCDEFAALPEPSDDQLTAEQLEHVDTNAAEMENDEAAHAKVGTDPEQELRSRAQNINPLRLAMLRIDMLPKDIEMAIEIFETEQSHLEWDISAYRTIDDLDVSFCLADWHIGKEPPLKKAFRNFVADYNYNKAVFSQLEIDDQVWRDGLDQAVEEAIVSSYPLLKEFGAGELHVEEAWHLEAMVGRQIWPRVEAVALAIARHYAPHSGSLKEIRAFVRCVG